MLADQIRHPPRELGLVKVFTGLPQLQGEGDGRIALTLADGEQQLEEVLLHARSDPRNHPEVEQGDRAVIGHEHVPGVRIGVEKAIHQNLLEIGTK